MTLLSTSLSMVAGVAGASSWSIAEAASVAGRVSSVFVYLDRRMATWLALWTARYLDQGLVRE